MSGGRDEGDASSRITTHRTAGRPQYLPALEDSLNLEVVYLLIASDSRSLYLCQWILCSGLNRAQMRDNHQGPHQGSPLPMAPMKAVKAPAGVDGRRSSSTTRYVPCRCRPRRTRLPKSPLWASINT